jgi:hypothetical protein
MPETFVDVCLKLMARRQYVPNNFNPQSFASEPKARIRLKDDGTWEAISNADKFRKAFGAHSGTWPIQSPGVDLTLKYSGTTVVDLNSYWYGGLDPVMVFFDRPAVLKMIGVAEATFDPADSAPTPQPLYWSYWYRIWSPTDMSPADRRQYMAYRGLKYHAAGAGSEQMEALLSLQGLVVMGAILTLAGVAAVSPWAKLAAAIVLFLRSLGFVCAILDFTYYRDRLNKFYALSNQPQVNDSQLEEGARAFAEVMAKFIVDCGMQKAGQAVGSVATGLRRFFSNSNARNLLESAEVAKEAENYEQLLRRSGDGKAADHFVGVIASVEHCKGTKALGGSVEAQTQLGLPRSVTEGYMEMCNAVSPPRVIVARAGNPESLKFIFHPNARPKPKWLKWKNAKGGHFGGTVVVPSREKILADAAEEGISPEKAIDDFHKYITKLEHEHTITLKPAPGAPSGEMFGAQVQVNGKFFISDVDNQAILIFEGGKWKPDPRWSLNMDANDSAENQSLLNAFSRAAKDYNQHGSQMNSQWLNPVTNRVEAVRMGNAGEKYLIICPGMKLFAVDGTQNLYSTLTEAFGVHVNASTGRVLP